MGIIILGMPLSSGDLIAGLALFVSAYAAWTTSRFNARQKSLIESQQKLNALLLEREKNDAENDKRAALGAIFVKIGKSYRLKIWNQGNASAQNVKIDFPDGNDIVIQSEVDEKFPLQFLDKYQSVELIAVVAMGTKRKHAVSLTWSDESSDSNQKTFYPTL